MSIQNTVGLMRLNWGFLIFNDNAGIKYIILFIQSFAQTADMEHGMNMTSNWQFKLISHLAYALENFKRTTIPGR